MTFAETFDSEKSLEEQVDFPLESHGLKLIVEGKINGKSDYSVKPPRSDFKHLTPLEAVYSTMVMKDDYVSREGFLSAHHSDVKPEIVKNLIIRLRKKLGKGTIKTRRGSGYYPGGLYLGELKDARNEEENILRVNGITCNVVTGYVRISNGEEGNVQEVYLTPLRTRILEIVMVNYKLGIPKDALFSKIYEKNGPANVQRKTLKANISYINKDLGGRFIFLKPERSPHGRYFLKD